MRLERETENKGKVPRLWEQQLRAAKFYFCAIIAYLIDQKEPHQRRESDISVVEFRASFRAGAQDHTEYAREAVDAALAYLKGNQVIAPYARSDLFDKPRLLIEDWENWCQDKNPL